MEIACHLAAPAQRKPKPADDSALGFGKIFSDHMFLMEYSLERGWHDARVVPYAAIPMDPASMVLHYGQEIFEGLKAYRGKGGAICLFRPLMNFERMNRSADRLCLPGIPVEDQLQAVDALVSADKDWIPATRGTSLYVRPTMIATEAGLGVRPSTECLFFIITGPVGNYYARGFEPVRILVEQRFVRAAKGGLGEAKTGANYAASLLAAKKAKEKGFDQVLWLDAGRLEQVEEVGTMNIFFVFGDELVTPPLSGSILPGVTRDSVLRIARDWGWSVSERPVGMGQVIQAIQDGSLREAFGTGTAAVISPVGTLSYKGKEYNINGGRIGEIARKLFDEITGIQYGEIMDRYGWVHQAG
ncbi:MAG: branched-chain amino acid aminotransferase [Deltaproteobacteria bacterium]|nr:branched-chain amino acid aminotransferase [Deltaproteobacteria bacterium]PWB62120.1 MAG: branched chain amino acid aminotransferase [Deltaproteobacteria bacterium]